MHIDLIYLMKKRSKMKRTWDDFQDSWLSATSLSNETSSWAIGAISKHNNEISAIEKLAQDGFSIEIENEIKELKKAIKNEIIKKENYLDDLSLNTTNSAKLQLSVPSSLNYLMKAWAAAEGRDLSSVALQCLETGLRLMMQKETIPSAAIERYNVVCKKRVALAEANNVWDRYVEKLLK